MDITKFLRWYAQAIQEVAIEDITPTDIRKYRVFLQEQVPISDVAYLLGHSTLDTTRIYTRARPILPQ